jgi:hypothetical protein
MAAVVEEVEEPAGTEVETQRQHLIAEVEEEAQIQLRIGLEKEAAEVGARVRPNSVAEAEAHRYWAEEAVKE